MTTTKQPNQPDKKTPKFAKALLGGHVQHSPSLTAGHAKAASPRAKPWCAKLCPYMKRKKGL